MPAKLPMLTSNMANAVNVVLIPRLATPLAGEPLIC
jgi:hypothetical protein